MKDPIDGLAEARLTMLAADVQVQLEKGTSNRPVLWLLTKQREKAVEAIIKLVEVDASEESAIRALQNEVRLFGDLVEHCRDLMEVGRSEMRKIKEYDRDVMAELVGGLDEETQRLIGVQPTSID